MEQDDTGPRRSRPNTTSDPLTSGLLYRFDQEYSDVEAKYVPLPYACTFEKLRLKPSTFLIKKCQKLIPKCQNVKSLYIYVNVVKLKNKNRNGHLVVILLTVDEYKMFKV